MEPPSSHRASFSTQHNNLTGCGGSGEDKQLALWERRARALRKMLLGFDQAREFNKFNKFINLINCVIVYTYHLFEGINLYEYFINEYFCLYFLYSLKYETFISGPPDMPFLVAVDVTATTSVTVRFQEPDSHDSPICTKFKVQWSLHDDFSVICGEKEVLDMKQRECRIDCLTQGQKYHFRAAAGNLKGYSRFRNSTPAHVTPSSK